MINIRLRIYRQRHNLHMRLARTGTLLALVPRKSSFHGRFTHAPSRQQQARMTTAHRRHHHSLEPLPHPPSRPMLSLISPTARAGCWRSALTTVSPPAGRAGPATTTGELRSQRSIAVRQASRTGPLLASHLARSPDPSAVRRPLLGWLFVSGLHHVVDHKKGEASVFRVLEGIVFDG